MKGPSFIDQVRLQIRSGNGGAGSVHFRRERFIPKGGPDGGDGGRGGDVLVRGNSHLSTLLHLRYRKHVFAGHGGNGAASQKTGAAGSAVVVEVPLGTVVRGEDGAVLAEVVTEGASFVLAAGGRGGMGNARFKSATRQAPRFAQPGEEGVERWVTVELKLLADVGLVGAPNAGKSTLLSVLSAAKPEIADYPFTTLVPQLGVVAAGEDRSFVLADIPGLIPGAAEGRGLGIRFLRHIERTKVLLFMVPCTEVDVLGCYEGLRRELAKYERGLLEKKSLLALTKADLLDAAARQRLVGGLPAGLSSCFISSLTGEGLERLRYRLGEMVG